MSDCRVRIRIIALSVAVFIAGLSLTTSAAWAQSQASDAAMMSAFASMADVSALIAKAKSNRKPDQANFVQPVVRMSPYTVNLEYRVAGINANASIHNTEAELFFVIDGSGTAMTGGRLRDAEQRNADNLSGSAIDDGVSRQVKKGDVLFVPEKTPHWFSPSDGGVLVLLSLHVPRP